MYAESSSYELRPDYFHIITLIFARGELQLPNLLLANLAELNLQMLEGS